MGGAVILAVRRFFLFLSANRGLLFTPAEPSMPAEAKHVSKVSYARARPFFAALAGEPRHFGYGATRFCWEFSAWYFQNTAWSPCRSTTIDLKTPAWPSQPSMGGHKPGPLKPGPSTARLKSRQAIPLHGQLPPGAERSDRGQECPWDNRLQHSLRNPSGFWAMNCAHETDVNARGVPRFSYRLIVGRTWHGPFACRVRSTSGVAQRATGTNLV